MGRPRKKVVKVEAVVVPEPVEPEPEPEPKVPEEVYDESSLFEDFPDEDDDEPEVQLALPPTVDIDLPAQDSDLSADEKKLFIALLNKEIPLETRAHQLGILARMRGSKTAAVGLRAIQEINKVTGISADRATEAPPMFQLPPDTKVSVTITKVVK
jgi:hypothetical protein